MPAGVVQTSLERRHSFWVFPGRTGEVSLFCEQEPDALPELTLKLGTAGTPDNAFYSMFMFVCPNEF